LFGVFFCINKRRLTMGSKNNPGRYDCYANAAPDEPMFVLLGRDRNAPQLVELWASERKEAGEESAMIEEARACAKNMRRHRYVINGEPLCEYGDSCTRPSTKIVTEENGVNFFWCGDFDNCYLSPDAGVESIDSYMAADGA
jgi:hypothetical protein